MTEQRCAAQHFGPWMVEPTWFAQAVRAVRDGTFKSERVVERTLDGEVHSLYENVEGVAVVSITGPMMKGDSSFGGTATVRTRKAIRVALADEKVRSILLSIDSPGGTVAGTADLADDVRSANQQKPVYAHISDLGCSAAYWVASQARRIFANRTAMIGSIGTMLLLYDTSGAYAKDGIKVYAVASGPFKAMGHDGVEVLPEHLIEFQREVDDLNAHFLSAVAAGRGLTPDRVKELADGRVHIGVKAKDLGLIDEVASLDAAMQAVFTEFEMTEQDFTAYAAAHPEAVQPFIEQGKTKALEESKPKNATASELKAAFPDDREFVMDRLDVDAPLNDHKIAYAERLKAKNQELVNQVATLKGELAKHDPASAGRTPLDTGEPNDPGERALTPERKNELRRMAGLPVKK